MAERKGYCRECRGLCCRYIGVPIDTPVTAGDFDDIRWYLLHKHMEVYVTDGDWYLNVKAKCKNLQDNHGCAIYKSRPRICRQYATGNCEITADQYDHEHHFCSAEQLQEYARGFLSRKRRLARLRGQKKRRVKDK